MHTEQRLCEELYLLIVEAKKFGEAHNWRVSYLSDIITEFEALADFLTERSRGNIVMTNEQAMLLYRGLSRLMTDDPIFVPSEIGEKLFDIKHRIEAFIEHVDN